MDSNQINIEETNNQQSSIGGFSNAQTDGNFGLLSANRYEELDNNQIMHSNEMNSIHYGSGVDWEFNENVDGAR